MTRMSLEIEEKCGNDLRLGDKSGDSTGEDLVPVDFRSELLQHRLEGPKRLAACLMITKYRIGPLGATVSRAYDALGTRSGRASWSCRRRGWCSTLPGRSAPGIPYHRRMVAVVSGKGANAVGGQKVGFVQHPP